ncbi:MAG: hypothetical protein ACIAQU_13075 [Phycisphaerales bacterium JB064]
MRYTREPIGHVAWFCETCRAVQDCEVRRIDFHRRTLPLLRKQIGVFGHDMKCSGCGSRLPADEGIAEIAAPSPVADPTGEVDSNEDHPMHTRLRVEADLMLGLTTEQLRLDLIARAFQFRQYDLDLPPEKKLLKTRRERILLTNYIVAAAISFPLTILVALDSSEGQWIVTLMFTFGAWALIATLWYFSRHANDELIAKQADARRGVRPLAASLAAMHATPDEIRTVIDACANHYWLAALIDVVALLGEVQKRRSTPLRSRGASSAARYTETPEISKAS